MPKRLDTGASEFFSANSASASAHSAFKSDERYARLIQREAGGLRVRIMKSEFIWSSQTRSDRLRASLMHVTSSREVTQRRRNSSRREKEEVLIVIREGEKQAKH